MKQTILVIEDNIEMLQNIKDILELASYNVVSSSNGREGLALIEKIKPDLVLCDIMLPELDGFSVLHIMSKNLNTASIPFIFLTAKTEKADLRKGMNLGADDYITKPFDGLELLNVIRLRLKKNKVLNTSFRTGTEGLNDFFDEVKGLKEFEQLTDDRVIRHYRKKEIVFLEGQHAKEMYFIEEGKIKTCKTNRDGKELITGLYQENQYLGYTPILDDTNHVETAIALTDAKLYVIPREDFLTMLYANREVARKFIQLLSVHLKDFEKRLLDMAYQSVRQRVASTLLKLHDAQKTEKENDQIVITLSRKDIANMIGTAIETLNRTLVDFKDEGLIDFTSKGLLILRKGSLMKMIQ